MGEGGFKVFSVSMIVTSMMQQKYGKAVSVFNFNFLIFSSKHLFSKFELPVFT